MHETVKKQREQQESFAKQKVDAFEVRTHKTYKLCRTVKSVPYVRMDRATRDNSSFISANGEQNLKGMEAHLAVPWRVVLEGID